MLAPSSSSPSIWAAANAQTDHYSPCKHQEEYFSLAHPISFLGLGFWPPYCSPVLDCENILPLHKVNIGGALAAGTASGLDKTGWCLGQVKSNDQAAALNVQSLFCHICWHQNIHLSSPPHTHHVSNSNITFKIGAAMHNVPSTTTHEKERMDALISLFLFLEPYMAGSEGLNSFLLQLSGHGIHAFSFPCQRPELQRGCKHGNAAQKISQDFCCNLPLHKHNASHILHIPALIN